MLLLIMLFVSIKFTTPSCRAGKVVFTHPASLPRTATGETPCTKELPLCKTKKIRIIQGIGLPRRADTKNQRTDTLVRRFKMFFTSCACQRCTHIAALVHFSFVFCECKVSANRKPRKAKNAFFALRG